jgi:predicted nucleic acid-binding protein
MRWLLDTNLLLRLNNPALPGHPAARDAVDILVRRGDELCLTAQNLIEFWAVATRPTEANGLGLTPEETNQRLNDLKARFAWLGDRNEIFTHWQVLVVTHKVGGKKTHDARLAAVMLAHGVFHVLTFNEADFSAFKEIAATNPVAIGAD